MATAIALIFAALIAGFLALVAFMAGVAGMTRNGHLTNLHGKVPYYDVQYFIDIFKDLSTLRIVSGPSTFDRPTLKNFLSEEEYLALEDISLQYFDEYLMAISIGFMPEFPQDHIRDRLLSMLYLIQESQERA